VKPAAATTSLLLFFLMAPVGTLAGPPLRAIPTFLHAHSSWSTGDQSLDQLASRARAVGVEAIFLAENHLQRYEYGLPPLRGLLRYRVEYPSILQKGPEAFLKAVEATNGRQKEVLIIPGAEVIPHYFWTGNILRGTLTMYNAQKNLLALGLYRPEDYWQLPVVGNTAATGWGPYSLWLLAPILLVIPGLWFLLTFRRRRIQLQHFQLTERRRMVGPGLLCLGAAAALLINNYPFRDAPVSAYDAGAGLRPHQQVIDFVSSRGGAAVWSLPEAKDHQIVNVWGLRATIRTDPYPSDLLRTDRFTAFGGIYEDTTTFTEPGQGWDQLLLDYIHGVRKAPAWAIGEAAYHYEGQAGKRFGEVQTVLLVEKKEPSALLGALRAGRAYALRRIQDEGLLLDRFQAASPGQPPAEAGSQLTLGAGDQPEIHAAVRSSSGRPLKIQARLIRSGTVVHAVAGETPLTLGWKDAAQARGARHFYRLDVRGPAGHQILSNPIFVRTT
jgi:hypothetical protein